MTLRKEENNDKKKKEISKKGHFLGCLLSEYQ